MFTVALLVASSMLPKVDTSVTFPAPTLIALLASVIEPVEVVRVKLLPLPVAEVSVVAVLSVNCIAPLPPAKVMPPVKSLAALVKVRVLTPVTVKLEFPATARAAPEILPPASKVIPPVSVVKVELTVMVSFALTARALNVEAVPLNITEDPPATIAFRVKVPEILLLLAADTLLTKVVPTPALVISRSPAVILPSCASVISISQVPLQVVAPKPIAALLDAELFCTVIFPVPASIDPVTVSPFPAVISSVPPPVATVSPVAMLIAPLPSISLSAVRTRFRVSAVPVLVSVIPKSITMSLTALKVRVLVPVPSKSIDAKKVMFPACALVLAVPVVMVTLAPPDRAD